MVCGNAGSLDVYWQKIKVNVVKGGEGGVSKVSDESGFGQVWPRVIYTAVGEEIMKNVAGSCVILMQDPNAT